MITKTGPKQRILDTAARLFYVQGYNTTGINQILAEANVAKASLYQHYGSKEEVGLAYLRRERELWLQDVAAILSKQATPVDKLLALFDRIEQFLHLNEFRGCRFINLMAEIGEESPLMRTEIMGHKSELRALFRQLVAESLPQTAEERVHALADAAHLLYEGAMVESKLHRDIWPVKTAKRTVKALIGT